VPEHIVYMLPESFSYEKAALIEAVSIAVHAAKVSEIEQGSTAVVVGARNDRAISYSSISNLWLLERALWEDYQYWVGD
jgi:D-arabinose 1-dehydrogenase-like Zn-dependent alcohol dehydrogenase